MRVMSEKMKFKNESGFTIVELMISLFIGMVVIVAVYSAYIIQQRSYVTQDQVVEMQQNIRAGLDIMTREIRMAGYDPQESGTAGIEEAYADAIYFTADYNEDGNVSLGGDDTGEHIAFDLYTNSGVSVLGITRSSSSITMTESPAGSGHFEAAGHQAIAENIERIEFFYTLNDGTQTTSPTAAQLNQISSVQISVLAVAGQRDAKYTNNNVYTPASGTAWDLNGTAAGNAPGDNFRRRLLIMTVQFRNMGL